MRPWTTSPHLWVGTGALFLIAFSLWGATYPVVDGWSDQWRDFSNATALAGHCSDPLYTDNPECKPTDHDFAIEPWMIVPWLVSTGCLLGSLAIAWPFVRRRTDT